jgi:2-phospho-L-lactate guanylyltransferase
VTEGIAPAVADRPETERKTVLGARLEWVGCHVRHGSCRETVRSAPLPWPEVESDQGPLVAVLVPVKAFSTAKVRLAPALDGPARAALARAMAERVLAAAGVLPVAVVCDHEAVARWARGCGARVLWEPGLGLNGAVQSGVARLAATGVQRVIVAHADLPLATDLGMLAGEETVVIVPDRHDDGTNVITVPSTAGFRFSYGPGSFARHCAEAERLGLALDVRRDAQLGYDVDLPVDLAGLAGTEWADVR